MKAIILNDTLSGDRRVTQGGVLGRAPPPAFHTLAKNMSLNRGPTHFTLELRPCIISFLL